MTKRNKCSDKKCPPLKKTKENNGKGDSPRNNFSEKFKKNYDSIIWKAKKK
jgi:hypothetical protein